MRTWMKIDKANILNQTSFFPFKWWEKYTLNVFNQNEWISVSDDLIHIGHRSTRQTARKLFSNINKITAAAIAMTTTKSKSSHIKAKTRESNIFEMAFTLLKFVFKSVQERTNLNEPVSRINYLSFFLSFVLLVCLFCKMKTQEKLLQKFQPIDFEILTFFIFFLKIPDHMTHSSSNRTSEKQKRIRIFRIILNGLF